MDAMSANSLGDVDSDDRLYSELSRVNNELINAQRDLVQRNVRLERAEEALRKAQGDLERQVQERTRELENTLSAFREEVSVHRKTEEKLRELSLTVLRIQDEERRHVARDLHDTVGQTLTALKTHPERVGKCGGAIPSNDRLSCRTKWTCRPGPSGNPDHILSSCIPRFLTSRVLPLPPPGTSTDLISAARFK